MKILTKQRKIFKLATLASCLSSALFCAASSANAKDYSITITNKNGEANTFELMQPIMLDRKHSDKRRARLANIRTEYHQASTYSADGEPDYYNYQPSVRHINGDLFMIGTETTMFSSFQMFKMSKYAPMILILSQYWNGTCTTFAITGAMDALYNTWFREFGQLTSRRRDIDIACTVDASISTHTTNPAGFGFLRGAPFSSVFDFYSQYGQVEKDSYNVMECIYPIDKVQEPFSWIRKTAQEYQLLTSNLLKKAHDHLEVTYIENPTAAKAEDELKKGNLLVAGINISYPYDNQYWACAHNDTNECVNGSHMAGDHAMIIAGYNSKLKLFIIANSWGLDNGINGYYLMSYKYFDAFIDRDLYSMKMKSMSNDLSIPSGSYRDSCRHITYDGTTVTAQCQKSNGDWINSSVSFPNSQCSAIHGLSNHDGSFWCE